MTGKKAASPARIREAENPEVVFTPQAAKDAAA
jgi:hypothetical protein